MKRQCIIIIILLFSAFVINCCARVQEQSGKGELKTVELKTLDAIPKDYGSLVSVTANPEFPKWAQLWFEDDDGIIRVVSVGFFDQKILTSVTEIPRN